LASDAGAELHAHSETSMMNINMPAATRPQIIAVPVLYFVLSINILATSLYPFSIINFFQ